MTESESELEKVRREFAEALESLTKVHTREELEVQRKKITVAKEKRLKIDADFRHMIDTKRMESEARARETRNSVEMKRIEITERLRLERARAKDIHIKTKEIRAKAMRRMPTNKTPLPFMKGPSINPDEKISVLMCPICKDPDMGNIINDEHICMNCMHELVPQNELNNYNRRYRRNWEHQLKKRKKRFIV